MIDVGTTGMGAGLPGGLGARLEHARPLAIDNLAARFPALTIIAAHPGWPWTDEMTAVALHKGNVYWELSGWAPKYFPPSLRTDIRGRLREKIMFGSDHPSLPYDRILREWDELGYDQSRHGPRLPRQRGTRPRPVSGAMATLDDVRRIAMSLPRTTEHLIGDNTKFRVGRLVYASVSADEERLGFGFPKEERAALVASEPDKFMMPLPGDERYQWVRARLPVLDATNCASCSSTPGAWWCPRRSPPATWRARA